MTDTEFAKSYPILWNFLDSVLRPDVDGYNLFEMLHRVLARAHPQRAEGLVQEFEKLSKDALVSPEDLERVFGQDLESPYLVVRAQNASDMVSSLAEYLRYLLDEGFGASKPRS